jgi:hypothetical protein
MLLAALIAAAVAIAAIVGFTLYMTSVPGQSYRGPLPPLTDEERALAGLLKRHVETIAAREHNIARYDELDKVARYIETALQSFGLPVNRQEFDVDDVTVRNIEVVIEPPAGTASPEVIVVGAHYDSARETRGANDNASGAAAVIELARLARATRKAKRRAVSGSRCSSTRSRPISGPSTWAACATPARLPSAARRSSPCTRSRRSASTSAGPAASPIRCGSA